MGNTAKLLALGLLVGCALQSVAQTITVPGSYAYGTKRTGSSNLWIMTVRNTGAQTLTVDSVRFGAGVFWNDSGGTPFSVLPDSSRTMRVWFSPASVVSSTDTMRLFSNATNLPVAPVALSGQGDSIALALGMPFWTHTVPLHPRSNTTRRVRAVRVIGDISGDSRPDVIVCTDNYWTMALNGNSSGGNDSLWAFNTYIHSASAGPIGSEGDYSYQKALAIASDLNSDGFNDVVIGTGGGNEHVYAISGKTGQMLWTFGTDAADSFALGDITGVDVSTDFNNDGIPDVIAVSAATGSGGVEGRRTIYCFHGATGNILWHSPALGFTHAVTAIGDISGDGVPDVIGAIGQPGYKASAYSGANGNPLWDFQLATATGGGKEVLALPIPGQTPDVVVGAFWGPICRVDGESGTVVWQLPTGSKDPTRLKRLHDLNNDGIDEIVSSLLVGDALCIDGATGSILWSYPANSGMDITVCPDLNNDGYDEVVVASQNADVLILRGNNGQLLYQYPLAGSEQARSVDAMADIDGNGSFEILAGSDASRVVLLSGGLDAGPVSVGEGEGVPEGFTLLPNYPNPFNPTTSIQIRLSVQSDLTVTIHDILGREVMRYAYRGVSAGVHTVVWDGKNASGTAVASGVYFYRARAGRQVQTRSMMLLK